MMVAGTEQRYWKWVSRCKNKDSSRTLPELSVFIIILYTVVSSATLISNFPFVTIKLRGSANHSVLLTELMFYVPSNTK